MVTLMETTIASSKADNVRTKRYSALDFLIPELVGGVTAVVTSHFLFFTMINLIRCLSQPTSLLLPPFHLNHQEDNTPSSRHQEDNTPSSRAAPTHPTNITLALMGHHMTPIRNSFLPGVICGQCTASTLVNAAYRHRVFVLSRRVQSMGC